MMERKSEMKCSLPSISMKKFLEESRFQGSERSVKERARWEANQL